ncbi:amino acid permease [Paenibacillus sediminis]|uniref:AAT family amino acid transporter n=1 Tax=Paenibacillus sediminis TaxID=664909 RepID=A0ABS4H0N9_9BACL|nr:amino acid permease [Paenibacillus sediminis]MBP1936091.1 AAT family amino acid transporter [Paenibacillus sediminis]
MNELKRNLKPRHILMMTLGGTIGAGIFKGSSSSIDMAGPSVLLTYVIGGLILLVVMRSLAGLVLKNKTATSLRDLIEPILGNGVGYTVGWIYWLDWVLVMAAEMAAAASFLSFWFPNVPLWVLALIGSLVMTAINLFQVRIYGETEYWLAGIKIATLVLFVLLGFVVLGTHSSVNEVAHNLTGRGGFFPHGFKGMVSAMLVVMFSFGGIEMIGMTLGETENPEETIPKASRSIIVRILIFYILPIFIILSLVPWDGLSKVTQSPFVEVFAQAGIPYVDAIMNFVLLTAVLSATNTGMYSSSRSFYEQAIKGNAPKFFAKLSKNDVPVRAILFSTIFLYIGVIVAFFAKGHTFDYLMVFPGYTVMIMWIFLVLSHIKQYGMKISTGLTLLTLTGVLIGVILTTPLVGTLITAGVLLLIVISYFVQRNKTAG